MEENQDSIEIKEKIDYFHQLTTLVTRFDFIKAFWQLGYFKRFSDKAKPTDQENIIKTGIRADGFFEGARFIIYKAWPLALLTLLLHDGIVYSNSSVARFEDSAADIFSGFTDNQEFWSSVLTQNFAWPLILLTLPLVAGGLNIIRRRNWHKAEHGDREKSYAQAEALLLWDARELEHAIALLEKAGEIVEEASSSTYQKMAALSTLANVVYHTSRFNRLNVFSALELAEHAPLLGRQKVKKKPTTERRDEIRKNVDEIFRANLKEKGIDAAINTLNEDLRQAAVTMLEENPPENNEMVSQENRVERRDSLDLAKARTASSFLTDRDKLHELAYFYLQKNSSYRESKNILTFLFRHYHLWSTGHARNRIATLPFFAIPLLNLYFLYHYFQTLEQSFQYWVTFYSNQFHCEAENKVWTYLPQAGDYECSICGDWKDIYYQNLFSGQNCLESVLNKTQSFEQVFSAIQRTWPFGIQSIDFSKQDWELWTEENWKTLAAFLSRPSTIAFQSLNLSLSASALNHTVSLGKAPVLGQMVASLQPGALTLNYWEVSENFIQGFFQPLFNITVNTIDFSHTSLADNRSLVLSEALSPMRLTDLRFSYCDLGDMEMHYLRGVFNISTLHSLSVNGNQFSGTGLTSLTNTLSFNVTYLDLSDNNFAGADLTCLGTYIQNGHLQTLQLNNTHLTDDNFMPFGTYFAGSHLISVNLNNNLLTATSMSAMRPVWPNTMIEILQLVGCPLKDEGLAFLGVGLEGSKVVVLDVTHINAVDRGLSIFSRYLPKTALQRLTLSANGFTDEGVADFISAAKNSTSLTAVDFSKNTIGDSGAIDLMQLIQTSHHIAEIYLSDTGITAASASTIANTLLNNGKLKILVLANNPIGSHGLRLIIHALEASGLQAIDISDTKLDATTANALFKILSGTLLEVVQVEGNYLNDEVALDSAVQLITPIPAAHQLGNRYVSPEFSRIVQAARPNTALQHISFANNNITITGAQALCRVLPSTDIALYQLDLQGNPIDSGFDINACTFSSSSRLKPFEMFTLLGMLFNPLFQLPYDFYTWINTHSIFVAPSQDNAALSVQTPLHFQITHCEGQYCIALNCQTVGNITTCEGQTIYLLASVAYQANAFLNFSYSEILLALLLAYRQELGGWIINKLPKTLSTSVNNALLYREKLLFEDCAAFALRSNSSFISWLAYDVVSALKNGEQSSFKKLFNLGFIYSIAFAVYMATGNSGLSLLLVGILMNVLQIKSSVVKAYRQHGLFQAMDEGIDEMACTLTGGSYLESSFRSLNR